MVQAVQMAQMVGWVYCACCPLYAPVARALHATALLVAALLVAPLFATPLFAIPPLAARLLATLPLVL